jgi:hypothetical protein
VVTIKGRVTEGLGVANLTIKLQMPFFAKEFPEIKACHQASINLELERPLHIWNPDHTTDRILWNPADLRGERFSFLRIRLECPLNSALQQAWLYMAHNSIHYHRFVEVEVLSKYIADLKYGMLCQIHLNKDHQELSVVVI